MTENYPTWCVSLWLSNNAASYYEWVARARNSWGFAMWGAGA